MHVSSTAVCSRQTEHNYTTNELASKRCKKKEMKLCCFFLRLDLCVPITNVMYIYYSALLTFERVCT